MNEKDKMQQPSASSFEASGLSRRAFIKASGLASVTLGGMTFLTACGPAAEGTAKSSDSSKEKKATFAADGTMRVGMEASYAPYNWQTSEETEFTIPIDNVKGAFADGNDVQFAKIIAEALKVKPVAVKMEFGNLVDACKQGQIDIILAGMTANEKRAKSVDFSDTYLEETIVVITKKDSKYASAKSLKDLSGAIVMGQLSTLYNDAIDQIPNVTHKDPLANITEVIGALEQGQVDAITYGSMSAEKLLSQYPDFVLVKFDEGKGFTGDYESNNSNAAIAKGQENILKKINTAIKDVPQEQRVEIWQACCARMPS